MTVVQQADGGPIDWGLESSFQIAIESIIREQCTQIEAAKVRLAMAHPSERLAKVIEAAHAAQLQTLHVVTAAVLNEALGLNPEAGDCG